MVRLCHGAVKKLVIVATYLDHGGVSLSTTTPIFVQTDRHKVLKGEKGSHRQLQMYVPNYSALESKIFSYEQKPLI